MFELISQEPEDYCEEHTSFEGELLYRLYRETNLKVMKPRMIAGKLQGAFLSFISRVMKPRNVLEIGAYTGYSTICIAQGVPQDGQIHTIEVDEEREEMIRQYFSESGYESKITLHIGDAFEIIPQLEIAWDLVLIDADKKDYLNYYNMILPGMKKGGVIIADNVLWSGKVLEEVSGNDRDTKAVKAFNDFVQKDDRVRNVMLPFRDGLFLIEKI